MKTLTLHLDDAEAADLEALSAAWKMPEETAALRALRVMKERACHPSARRRLQAFRDLQKSLQLTPEKAQEWMDAIREARG